MADEVTPEHSEEPERKVPWGRVAAALTVAFVASGVARALVSPTARLPRHPFHAPFVNDEWYLLGCIFTQFVMIETLLFRYRRRRARLVLAAIFSILVLSVEFVLVDRFLSLPGSQTGSLTVSWGGGPGGDVGGVELSRAEAGRLGWPVLKVIVFKRKPVQAPVPQITDYLLLDAASGKEICGAHISEIQLDRNTGALVPKRIELRWPSEKLKLALRMDGTTINPQVPPQVFVRQTSPNIQSFNLARMQIDNTPPPQAYSGLDSKIRPAQNLVP